MSTSRPPTPASPRIRWERNDDGSRVTPAHEGYVGTVGEALFFIFEPDDRDPWWILTSSLPGLPGAGQAERRAHSDDTDGLRDEAERWLEEFVTSLGVAFPAEPPMVCTACRKPVRKVPGTWAASVWDHADAEDGRACPSLGAHLTGTPIMGMPAESANPAPAGEKE